MLYLVIIASLFVISFFIWVRADYQRRNKERGKKKTKHPFRTENDLETYEKAMKDEDYNPVNFDDAE